MTPRILIPIFIALLLIAFGYGIAYHVHRCPDVAPAPVNIEAERLRIRAEIERAEVLPLKDSLNAAQVRVDSLRVLQPRVVVKWREVAELNWGLSDTEAGAVYADRVNARVRDSLHVSGSDTPLITMTPIQVRTANLMLDECDRDRELLTIKQAEVAQLDAALATSKAIIERLQTDRDHLLQLDSLNRTDIERLRIAGDRAERKLSRRTRWLWIIGAVAAVETAIIGVAVSR